MMLFRLLFNVEHNFIYEASKFSFVQGIINAIKINTYFKF